MTHYAIIGSGITGTTTAWVLRKKGYDVTVFDRHRYPAMETSFANGGQLSASNAEVWTNIGTMIKGVKWMFTPDAPLLFNPKPSWHKYSWMMEFASNFRNYKANTITTTSLAIESRKHMTAFAEEAGVEFNRENRGILHFYKKQSEFDHAHKVNELLAKGGLDRKRLTPDEVYQIEPAIKSKVIGGYFTESDFTGDIHKFTVGLAQAAAEAGVTFNMNCDVSDIDHDGDKPNVSWTDFNGARHSASFDGVVVTAGVGSRDIAARLGDRVNIYPVKGYSITVNMDDAASQAAAPWASLLDDGAKIVTARLGDDRFRVAGTAEINGENYDIRADRIAPLTRWVQENFPGISTENVIPWAGLRPMMPNMMPRIGKGKKRGVYYNTGHGHLGWTLSCYSAEAIGDIIHSQHNQ
ncbi:MAG: D-amino acid dehydrogenase [Alphaproteobacteria bacterium]|nr:D-amino acid dehydrogenase [Alphaproteobacteria bacterium]